METTKARKGLAWPAEIRALLSSPVPVSDDELKRYRPLLETLQSKMKLLRELGGTSPRFSPALVALFDRVAKLS